MRTYLIPGYGIPKDIATDDNYRRYLSLAFNAIFDEARDEDALVIFSGGNTDCHPPYRRTEAGEMLRLFREWTARPACRAATKKWRLLVEKRAVSTLENLLYAKAMLRNRADSLVVFCESTRVPRIRAHAKKIFGAMHARVSPIDFDLSSNRYLDPSFIRKKERRILAIERRALGDAVFFKKFRKTFLERIRFLRDAGPERHVDAVREWWEMKLRELEK